jgi:outer membrane protein assembly factor BamB
MLLLASCWSTLLQGEEWANWRGPRGDGTSTDKQLSTQWSETENVAWKTPLTIMGHSSPITWKQQVFVVGANETETTRVLAAYDRTTGKENWSQVVVKSPLEKKHKLNSFASGTPATDGERVYVTFLDEKEMVVAAYSLQGKQLWSVRPGSFSSQHGYCSSPVLYKELVIVNGDHDGQSYIVALDRATGKTVWKTPRVNKTRSYCTPIIRDIDGKPQLMLSGSKCVAAFNPDNGELIWTIDGPTEQFVASPVYHQELLFITGGFPDKHIIAINPRGTGNISKEGIVWHHLRKGVSYVPSPVAVEDYFVVTSDEGIGTCFDTKTGTIHWSERMGKHYSGSMIVSGNGLIYVTADDGVTKIIKPGNKLEIVATNELKEYVYSSLAPSDGQLFIRGEKHLWCIGKP